MKRFTFRIFGYDCVLSFGIVTLQDVEDSIQRAVNRKSFKNHSHNQFIVGVSSDRHLKGITVYDRSFCECQNFLSYRNEEETIEELLYKAKKHFDEIK